MMLELLFQDPVLFFRIIVIVILSICLHELGHGFAAISQGDRTPILTGHITLNPVVHMGWSSLFILCFAGLAWGQMPITPSRFRHPKWSGVLVAASGPLTNLLLAIIFTLLLHLAIVTPLGIFLSREFAFLFAYINVMLCLFNLLPIPPLDGFHVVKEFFPPLKALDGSPYGLMVLMILLITGTTSGLVHIAQAAVMTGLALLGTSL